MQVQKLNEITSDLHLPPENDRDVAIMLLEHGKFARAYLFCTDQINALYQTVPTNRHPKMWGPHHHLLLEPEVIRSDETAYASAEEAFRRAVRDGFDPKTIDPYYDSAVPVHQMVSARKRD